MPAPTQILTDRYRKSQRAKATKHGYYHEPWYKAYMSMMQRCYLPNAANYHLYGGRGIAVCGAWHNIHNFKEWVDNSGYRAGLTIDRKYVNGDYCPENCRWATVREQANNRRTNIFYDCNGSSHTLAEWSEIKGINRHTLWTRITRYKWPIEKALNTAPMRGARMEGGGQG